MQRFVWFLLAFIEAFEAVEGVDSAEGVAVGDVLLPLAVVPLAILLGIVLAIELSEGDCLGVVVIPSVELADALLVFPFGVGGGVHEHEAAGQYQADGQGHDAESGDVEPGTRLSSF